LQDGRDSIVFPEILLVREPLPDDAQHFKDRHLFRRAPKSQALWRRRLQRAYQRPTYTEAKTDLTRLQQDLEDRNQSAARSLAEGLEETLTLHRLGVFALVGLILQDDEWSGIDQCLSRRAVCQCGSLDEFPSAAALVGHRVAGYRAAAPESQRLSPLASAAGGPATRSQTEEGHDKECGQYEPRSHGEFN